MPKNFHKVYFVRINSGGGAPADPENPKRRSLLIASPPSAKPVSFFDRSKALK